MQGTMCMWIIGAKKNIASETQRHIHNASRVLLFVWQKSQRDYLRPPTTLLTTCPWGPTHEASLVSETGSPRVSVGGCHSLDFRIFSIFSSVWVGRSFRQPAVNV